MTVASTLLCHPHLQELDCIPFVVNKGFVVTTTQYTFLRKLFTLLGGFCSEERDEFPAAETQVKDDEVQLEQ
jgi:hypothetical protein